MHCSLVNLNWMRKWLNSRTCMRNKRYRALEFCPRLLLMRLNLICWCLKSRICNGRRLRLSLLNILFCRCPPSPFLSHPVFLSLSCWIVLSCLFYFISFSIHVRLKSYPRCIMLSYYFFFCVFAKPLWLWNQNCSALRKKDHRKSFFPF